WSFAQPDRNCKTMALRSAKVTFILSLFFSDRSDVLHNQTETAKQWHSGQLK
ncbi:hypothetical protein FRX31_022522, partial [Thalictrum thalictroides]